MKTLLLSLVLGLSLSASASYWKEYKGDSLELLNFVQSTCPDELQQAMVRANRIVSAEQVGGQMPSIEDGREVLVVRDTLTIVTAAWYIYGRLDVAKLTITRDLIPDVIFVPSKSPNYRVTCKVEQLNR